MEFCVDFCISNQILESYIYHPYISKPYLCTLYLWVIVFAYFVFMSDISRKFVKIWKTIWPKFLLHFINLWHVEFCYNFVTVSYFYMLIGRLKCCYLRAFYFIMAISGIAGANRTQNSNGSFVARIKEEKVLRKISKLPLWNGGKIPLFTYVYSATVSSQYFNQKKRAFNILYGAEVS